MQLRIFKLRVCRLWQSVLVRRSQRAQMRRERFIPVLNRWILFPRALGTFALNLSILRAVAVFFRVAPSPCHHTSFVAPSG